MDFEICIGSYEDAVISKNAGATRVELNSAIFLGGITPSLGTLKAIKQNIHIKVIAMVRPRASGFFYNEYEYDVMKEDANLFIENGADGIAFGFLTEEGNVDKSRCKEFVKICKNKDAVFHRAFDLTVNPFKALEDLIDCNITRVLTSGQEKSAFLGMNLIRELVLFSKDRIEILPAAGINHENAYEIVKNTGVNGLHFSALECKKDSTMRENPKVNFLSSSYLKEDLINTTNFHKVRNIIDKFK